MEPKVFVLTPWRHRNRFVPIYNHLWTNQKYSNYSINIFIEKYMMNVRWKHEFNDHFNVVKIDQLEPMSIGRKINFAMDYIPDNYDYVVLASSDDYYSPMYISKCIRFMQENSLQAINMSIANYIKLSKINSDTVLHSNVNTSASYGGMFVIDIHIAKKFKWNESIRSGEDRNMVNQWRKHKIKYTHTDIHSSDWLGIIHGGNWNTHGCGWQFKALGKEWLYNYLYKDQYAYDFYNTLVK